jgi:hypothetical protein
MDDLLCCLIVINNSSKLSNSDKQVLNKHSNNSD